MSGTTGKKELVGKVRHIFLDHGVFGTTAECCLAPSQTISVEGVEGLHPIDSLEIDHMRHDRVEIGSPVAIKASTIPIGWVDYDAKIWLHGEAETKPAGHLGEHDLFGKGGSKPMLDGG